MQTALRAKAKTLSVATTGSISLAATATGYTRASGSFITDGFAQGMEVTPSGFATNTVDVITNISSDGLTMTVLTARAVEVAAGGRTLAVLFPQTFSRENAQIALTTTFPFIEEQFPTGPTSLDALGPNANTTASPIYVLNVYTPSDMGFLAGSKYADAILALFCSSTTMTLPNGDTLFVRADVGPYRGQVHQADGWSMIPVKIPLQIFSNNAI